MEDLCIELKAVLAVMDTIPIEGLVNQKKYVNCAERVRLVLEILESAGKPEEPTENMVDNLSVSRGLSGNIKEYRDNKTGMEVSADG